MSDKKHLNILVEGARVWNQWREANRNIKPIISDADSGVMLYGIDLAGINLSSVELSGAYFYSPYNDYPINFKDANFSDANLSGVRLEGASLLNANLSNTDLSWVNLSGVNFSGANLLGANLLNANLIGANLESFNLSGANLSGANLKKVQALFANFEGVTLDDLPAYIKLVISSLPVVMTWMLAYVQAEWFNRCEYVRELLRKYKKKAIEMSFDYIDDIALVRLKADNKAMLNHSAEYYTVESVELAELDAVIKYFQYKFQERKKYYQLERQVLNNEYEEEKRKFEAEYPEFEENVEEHAPEQINRLRQAYEAEKSQTLANKFKEIDDQKKEAENDCYRRLREDWQQLEIELNTAIRDFEKKTLKQREQPLRSFQLA